jgi:O-antigen/teichoic acid export membrane protein
LIALQNVLRWLSNQIDVLVLGRLLPTAALGGYHVARNLTDMPNTKLGQLFGQLPLAAFARLQDRPEALRQALQEALGMMLRVTVPGFVLLAVVAPEFVGVVLGPRWLGIAPLIAILAWAMPLRLVLTISTQALNAVGRPAIGALANGLLSLAIAAGALLAAPFGLAAIAGAVAVAYVVATLIALGIAGRHTGFGPRALAGSLWRPLLAASVMAGAVAAARLLLPEAATDWQVLATLLVVAAPAYAGPLLLVDRRGVRETVRFLRS